MKAYSDQTFRSVGDFDSGKIFQDMRFEMCKFHYCSISATRDPSKRSTLRNIELINCSAERCLLGPGILEDCSISGLKTGADLFQTFAAVFRHVKIGGKMDRLMLSGVAIDVHQWPELRRQFEAQNDEYYKTVDWALDISSAEFVECDIRKLPIHLIRRDPETQMVITRLRAMVGDWRNMPIGDYWKGMLQVFLKLEEPSMILIAPKRDKNFRQLVKGLQVLRAERVVEVD